MNLKPDREIDFDGWNWGDGELYTDLPGSVLDCDVMDKLVRAVGDLISEVINDELAGGIEVQLDADGDVVIALPLTIKGELSLSFTVSLSNLVKAIPEGTDTAGLSHQLQQLADITRMGKTHG